MVGDGAGRDNFLHLEQLHFGHLPGFGIFDGGKVGDVVAGDHTEHGKVLQTLLIRVPEAVGGRYDGALANDRATALQFEGIAGRYIDTNVPRDDGSRRFGSFVFFRLGKLTADGGAFTRLWRPFAVHAARDHLIFGSRATVTVTALNVRNRALCGWLTTIDFFIVSCAFDRTNRYGRDVFVTACGKAIRHLDRPLSIDAADCFGLRFVEGEIFHTTNIDFAKIFHIITDGHFAMVLSLDPTFARDFVHTTRGLCEGNKYKMHLQSESVDVV